MAGATVRSSSWVVVALVAGLSCDAPSGASGGPEDVASPEAPPVPLETPVRPRWVLRDKDGALVPALVEPHCGDPVTCRLPDIGASPQFPCVHVKTFKDRYVGLLYGVAHGSLSACAHAIEPVSDRTMCSSEPGCQGPFFAGGEEAPWDARPGEPRTIYIRDGQFMYVSTAQAVEGPCFLRDVIEGCQQNTFAEMYPRFPVLPIPDEYVDLLVEGAPYTFEVVYE